MKPAIWEEVTAALDSLREEFDVAVIEGAGSPSARRAVPIAG